VGEATHLGNEFVDRFGCAAVGGEVGAVGGGALGGAEGGAERVKKAGRGVAALFGRHCNGISGGVAESGLEGRGRFRLGGVGIEATGDEGTGREVDPVVQGFVGATAKCWDGTVGGDEDSFGSRQEDAEVGWQRFGRREVAAGAEDDVDGVHLRLRQLGHHIRFGRSESADTIQMIQYK